MERFYRIVKKIQSRLHDTHTYKYTARSRCLYTCYIHTHICTHAWEACGIARMYICICINAESSSNGDYDYVHACMNSPGYTRARKRTHARTRCTPVYIVRNNEEFAQTGIPTFFKQGERGQTALYGRMDKHTQPRITHRASRPGDMRSACLCMYTPVIPVSHGAYTRAPAHRTLAEHSRTETSSLLPPRKLSTITPAQQAP